MKRVDDPIERLRRYDDAPDRSGVAEQHLVVRMASIHDAPCLMAVRDPARPDGATMAVLRTMLSRAPAPAGSEGVVAALDVDMQERSVDTLDRMGAPLAAVMVRAHVASGRAAPAGGNARENRGGRP